MALVNLGDVLLNLDRAEEATEELRQARSVFAEIEEADGTGYSLYWLGRCHESLGRDAVPGRPTGRAGFDGDGGPDGARRGVSRGAAAVSYPQALALSATLRTRIAR